MVEEIEYAPASDTRYYSISISISIYFILLYLIINPISTHFIGLYLTLRFYLIITG